MDTNTTPDQTENLVDAPQQSSAPDNGRRPTTRSRPRPLGQQAVSNRVRELRTGRELSPPQLAMLRVTARLMIHLENASNRLYREGELTIENEPKQLLGRVQDLAKQIKVNLEDIFGDDATGDDPLSVMMGRHR